MQVNPSKWQLYIHQASILLLFFFFFLDTISYDYGLNRYTANI